MSTLVVWSKVHEVETFFSSITAKERKAYSNYWGSIAPTDYLETFERWLFAFCSVHTSWEANVRGYEAIKPWFGWQMNSGELKNRLVESRIGLHHNRTRFIAEFCDKFWANPSFYYKTQEEDWTTYRNRLVKDILGLGMAKVSFGIEMIYPLEAQVTCFDTHMFQFYGLDQVKHSNQYKALEVHWVDKCTEVDVAPTLARAIFWDKKQQRTDSRYWTYVLETK